MTSETESERVSKDELDEIVAGMEKGDRFRVELGPQRDEPEKFGPKVSYMEIIQTERYRDTGGRQIARVKTVGAKYSDPEDLEDSVQYIGQQLNDEGDALSLTCYIGSPGREVRSITALDE